MQKSFPGLKILYFHLFPAFSITRTVWFFVPIISGLLISLGIVNLTFAGTTGKLAGRIMDASTADPLAGANIVVKAELVGNEEIDLSTPVGAASDADGQYFILNVRPGNYMLEVTYIGYQTVQRKNVKVEVDRTNRQDFQLTEQRLTTEDIMVTADRIPLVVMDQTSASAKVAGDDIKAMPVESFNDVIRLTAGVTTGIGGELHIRGGRTSEIKYYVDGIAVSNPFSNAIAIPVENNAIQELEIISGTFNAEYGQAMSGIVNIVTREGTDKFRATLSAYTGDFLSSRQDVFYHIDDINPLAQKYLEGSISGPLFAHLKYFLSGRYQKQDNWLYGQRVFLTSDSSNITSPDPENYYIESNGDSAAVPMTPYESISGQIKLTWQASPTSKFSYTLIGNMNQGMFYNKYYQLNPESRPASYTWGMNHIFKYEQQLSSRLFYDMALAYYEGDQKSYKYEDPYDTRYRDTYKRGAYQPTFVLSTGGVDPNHSLLNSKTLAFNTDLMLQAGRNNLIKSGVEIRTHTLDYEYFTVEVDPIIYGNYNPRIPPLTSFLHDQYQQKPLEFAAYIQDKIEIEDLIVNVGLRFDYFKSNGSIPTDFRDPANKLYPRPNAFTKVKAKSQISPRAGLAFPISASGVIHAAYGQFFQVPEFSRLYENPEFEVGGSYTSFIGNADLDAQRTDMYEIGIQQQLTSFMAVDVTAFYRDIRNLLGSELYVTYQNDIIYGRYINTDHGDVRGVTVSAKIRVPETGISAGIDYTYQVAKGIASDPKQKFFDAGGRNESSIILTPLNWDLRHTGNAYVNYTQKSWGSSVILRLNSGYPFMPLDPTTQRKSSIIELRNEGRYEGDFFIDIRTYKKFNLYGFDLELFLKIENLLDTYRKDLLPQIDPIDEQSQTEKGWNIINSRYKYELNPALQPVPREVKLGLKIDF